ncbi:MAG: ABC transporter ATP-binding protein [Planctomycetes bacterium]|nr:ABC transporter ATP-binding protein [Planctomycetota bacterium]
MVTPAIALEEVFLNYRDVPALAGLTLEVQPGEILALLGPSGSGKSSLVRLVLGLVAPARGAVRLQGEAVSREGRILKPPEERRLAVVFQDLALWPHLTVRGNLEFGLKAQGLPAAERNGRIGRMLGRLGLQGKERRFPGELSGGERQRVAIARAMVLEPRAVLLDEPLASLDASLKHEMLFVFRELLKERRLAALYVTHDLREAASLGDRIAVLERGRLVQTGSLEQLREAPGSEFVKALAGDLFWMGGSRA